MKEKLLLIGFGLFVGLVFGGLAYAVSRSLRPVVPEGASFESIEDLQRAMLEHDDRDVLPDQSVSLRSIIQPHPSDLIIYDLRPNLQVKFQGVPVQTNSCGMRDQERPIEKEPGVYRIALLGDSFAFGWGVPIEQAFGAVLERILNNFAEGRVRVEVLNFGVPGYSTFQEVATFEEKALDFDPDLVLVFFIDNDFGLPFFIRDIRNSGQMMSGTTFAKKSWAGDDPAIVEQNKKLLGVLDANKALRRLSAIGAERGIPVYVAVNPNRHSERVKKQLWILRQKKHGLRLIWMLDEFREIVERRNIEHSTLSLPTDPHPSVVKHAILGEQLAAALLPEIGAAVDASERFERDSRSVAQTASSDRGE